MRSAIRWLALISALLCCPWPASGFQSSRQAAPRRNPTEAPQDRVDINHATVQELMKVPGLTRTWAARIVRFRPYRTKLDLLENGVLPSDVYNRIKDHVIAHRREQ